MMQDAVFKALADDTRRTLLDMLFKKDGQTLSELCDAFEMTRHGVMKHLRILEDAELISTQKVGREKHHYINPVPIQIIYDRWVSKYAQPWAMSLSGLKTTLETSMSDKPSHQQQIYISTTPEKLWKALTDGTFTRQYYMGSTVQSTWEVNAPYRYVHPEGHTLVEGIVLEVEPPNKLVTSFNAMWIPDDERGGATIVTFLIEPVGDTCKLTVLHKDLDPTNALTPTVETGWSQILSGLKTLLETGKPLSLPEEAPPDTSDGA
ncbi:MAG: metalloregulator ArsR/SmtB family transcription factor [Chloroflexota bacterium]